MSDNAVNGDWKTGLRHYNENSDFTGADVCGKGRVKLDFNTGITHINYSPFNNKFLILRYRFDRNVCC